MAKRSKADPLNKMIHMASELQRHAKNMAKKDAPIFQLHTARLADAVRDRLLKGIAEGYDINGKQFTHHSEFTTKLRKRDALGGKMGASQFGGGDDAAYEHAAMLEKKPVASKVTKKTSTIGGYTFSAGPNETILYDGRSPGSGIIDMIGDTLQKSKVVLAEKTSVKIKADSLQPYQKLQHKGFTIRSSNFADVWNTKGKQVPAREWLGIPMTYRENHPGWKKAMGILSDDLEKEYGRIIKGGKADLHWYKKSKEGNQRWQDLKKKAK